MGDGPCRRAPPTLRKTRLRRNKTAGSGM
jgi:hypothetical protein